MTLTLDSLFRIRDSETKFWVLGWTHKNMLIREDGRCSLHNSGIICETYAEDLTDRYRRALCASSLWLCEQKHAEVSKRELLDQDIFDGTMLRRLDQERMGKISLKLYGKKDYGKRMEKDTISICLHYRHKRKGNFRFWDNWQITNNCALIPLFIRITNRFPEDKIQDRFWEDKAIIGAVKSVFLKWLIPFVCFTN